MTNQLQLGSTHRFLKSLAFSTLLALSSLGISSTIAAPINVNTATQAELESIKGIGPSKAKTIIAERTDGGHFQDANDLQKRVRGIGMKTVEKMVDNGLTIESPGAFREPNGKTAKESAGLNRRNSRGQGGSRTNSDRAEGNHCN